MTSTPSTPSTSRTKPHHPAPSRLTNPRAAVALGLIAAVGLAMPACQQRPVASSGRTTDAGFDALRQKRGPASLLAPTQPGRVDTDTQQRITESISMLDDYFAQTEQGNTNASPGGAVAYDPSAERGPTGSSHLTQNPGTPIESAMLARAQGTTNTTTTPPTNTPANTQTAEQRLLGGLKMIPASEITIPPRANGEEPIVVTLASPVFEPNFSWPTTPGGMGIVTADSQGGTDEGSDDWLEEGFDEGWGTAVASADGSLPAMDGVTGNDPGTLNPGPGSGETGLNPEQRKSELVEELVGLLMQVAQTNDDPYQAGLALAGLETLSPGALYELVDSGTLLPNETEILLTAHEFFQGLAADPMQASTENAMSLVDQVRERLNETAPLRITAAELCTRVWGYGQYETFDKTADGSYRFMVGRRQPIIIYTEVDRFGRSPVVDVDGVSQWKVALSQELQVFHLADDLLVTARSAETDTSLSRSKMRDYYLINQTYLPETLTLGKYHLKIIMRDQNKDAIAETVIPFQIVASSTLDME
ncbi:MAG: hypothetical protein ACI89L_001180 [Phycisphaerales bacterium]|jgi:hypothetical protein